MISGEVVACRLAMLRQTAVAAPPQSSRLTLRKRRETSQAEGDMQLRRQKAT